MEIISRLLDLNLPPGQSAFLWGARKVGKTTFLRERYPESIVYDFLDTKLHLDLIKRPWLLKEKLLAETSNARHRPVILDEVQKVPALLDEVHWLIENEGTFHFHGARGPCRVHRSRVSHTVLANQSGPGG